MADNDNPFWMIWVDSPMTRRKSFHVVVDPEGVERYRSRLLWQCIEWLEAEGVEVYWLRASDPPVDGFVPGLRVSKEDPPWPS